MHEHRWTQKGTQLLYYVAIAHHTNESAVCSLTKQLQHHQQQQLHMSKGNNIKYRAYLNSPPLQYHEYAGIYYNLIWREFQPHIFSVELASRSACHSHVMPHANWQKQWRQYKYNTVCHLNSLSRISETIFMFKPS